MQASSSRAAFPDTVIAGRGRPDPGAKRSQRRTQLGSAQARGNSGGSGAGLELEGEGEGEEEGRDENVAAGGWRERWLRRGKAGAKLVRYGKERAVKMAALALSPGLWTGPATAPAAGVERFQPQDNMLPRFNHAAGGERAEAGGQAEAQPGRGGRRRREVRKWRDRRGAQIDPEFDVVIVPSDGISMSGSDSDDSDWDWGVGWLEPHGGNFLERESEEDPSFAVLVPCYRSASPRLALNRGGMQDGAAAMGLFRCLDDQKEMERWLAVRNN